MTDATTTMNKLDCLKTETPFKDKPLLKALKELGILPYTPDSVDRYKKEMVRLHPENFWNSISKLIWDINIFSGIIAFASILYIPTLFIVGLITGTVFLFGSLSLMILALSCMTYWITDNITCRREGVWIREELKGFYSLRDIPDSVLKIREDLQKRVPGIVLYADRFKQHTFKDPFLFAVLDSEKYYVAVWGNEEFVKASLRGGNDELQLERMEY